VYDTTAGTFIWNPNHLKGMYINVGSVQRSHGLKSRPTEPEVAARRLHTSHGSSCSESLILPNASRDVGLNKSVRVGTDTHHCAIRLTYQIVPRVVGTKEWFVV
jgi:hypothetical protein